ncbi:MAG: translation initiation factor IF-5A [Candidatus Nanoarchaeia archaeon]|nr:translation initiation factor IF-5A [Candidatus Nanoarchaeia archaeon]MDD5740864.1 translation initiation factor IF-5A [Candidatus Nanoarchaeia archaeon]
MPLKLIDATEAKPGATIVIDNVPCIVRTNDMSKTGKHGHTKCRIEAISIIDEKKKVLVVSGHERFDVPLVNKNRGQILSISGDKASIMDLENYETLELPMVGEVKENLKDGDQVEYWDIEGVKLIKRKI